MLIKLINNPFEIDDIVEKNIEYEYCDVSELFKRHFDPFSIDEFRVICSGMQVEKDEIPSMYDEVIYVRDIRGGSGGVFGMIAGVIFIAVGFFTFGATSVIGAAMIAGGAGMLLGGVMQLFMPTATNDVSSMDNTATYSWDGIQNIVGEGNVTPVVYGTHRIGGVYIEGYIDGIVDNGVSADNYLYLLAALSEGPVHAVHEESVDIAGSPMWTYDTTNVSVERFYSPLSGYAIDLDAVITASRSRIDAESAAFLARYEYNENGGGDKDSTGGDNDSDSSSQGNSGYGR